MPRTSPDFPADPEVVRAIVEAERPSDELKQTCLRFLLTDDYLLAEALAGVVPPALPALTHPRYSI